MVLTEIVLLKWKTNASPISEDCWFAVQLSRRIWGKSRSYLKDDSQIYVSTDVSMATAQTEGIKNDIFGKILTSEMKSASID